jgi:hypothetical protein
VKDHGHDLPKDMAIAKPDAAKPRKTRDRAPRRH